MISDEIDLEATLGEAFHVAGRQLFLVGGAVRDEIRGVAHQDLDFATDAHPSEISDIVSRVPGSSQFRAGERFGTVGGVVGGRLAQITTYRAEEVYRPGSRKPDVQFGSSIQADLSRRDFTINAMARPARRSAKAAAPRTPTSLLDPFGGLADLRSRVIRAVGDGDRRFQEDPLRLLRAVRFAAMLNFSIEQQTWTALVVNAALLGTVSRERIGDELTQMLVGPHPSLAFTLLRDGGLLAETSPEMLDLTRQSSVWEHTLAVVQGVKSDLTTRWAALLLYLDPPKRPEQVGLRTEEPVEPVLARQLLRSLRLSKRVVDSVDLLISTHAQVQDYAPDWTDGAVRRLVVELGDDLDRATDLSQSDCRARNESCQSDRGPEGLVARKEKLSATADPIPSPIDGAELMAHFHRAPGPWISQIKEALAGMVVDGDLDPNDGVAVWSAAERLENELSG